MQYIKILRALGKAPVKVGQLRNTVSYVSFIYMQVFEARDTLEELSHRSHGQKWLEVGRARCLAQAETNRWRPIDCSALASTSPFTSLVHLHLIPDIWSSTTPNASSKTSQIWLRVVHLSFSESRAAMSPKAAKWRPLRSRSNPLGSFGLQSFA